MKNKQKEEFEGSRCVYCKKEKAVGKTTCLFCEKCAGLDIFQRLAGIQREEFNKSLLSKYEKECYKEGDVLKRNKELIRFLKEKGKYFSEDFEGFEGYCIEIIKFNEEIKNKCSKNLLNRIEFLEKKIHEYNQSLSEGSLDLIENKRIKERRKKIQKEKEGLVEKRNSLERREL